MISRACYLFILLFIAASSIAQTAPSAKQRGSHASVPTIQYGTASFYAKKFTGRKTASGEIYDPKKPTAAHNSLKIGTWIRVTNTKNKRSVIVKVNDRLHHKNKRLVDLSYSAASTLGYVSKGLAHVKVEILGMTKPVEAN